MTENRWIRTMPGAQAHAEGLEWHHSDYGPEFLADIVHLGKRDDCPGQHAGKRMAEERFLRVGCFEWIDIPTPQGPDMQVRLSRVAEPVIAVLEWRVKPDRVELDEQGITREESNRWPS